MFIESLVLFLSLLSLPFCVRGLYLGPCDPTCLGCSGPGANECVGCLNTLWIISGGTCSCKPGNYSTGGLLPICLECDSSCDNCTGAGPNNCSSCPTGSFLYDKVCYPDCATSEYFDEATLTCKSCDPSCLTCSDSTASSCLSCASGTVVSGSCVCGNGEYKDGSYICQACAETCKECSGGLATDCTDCDTGMTLGGDGQCTCDAGTYLVSSPSVSCEACNTVCDGCSGPLASDCTACVNNLESISGECGCPAGKYFDSASRSCLDCDSLCAECSGGLSTDCTSCKNNMELDTGTGECGCPSDTFVDSLSCTDCDASCATCSGPSASECTDCPSGFTLVSGECRCSSGCTCPTGTYHDSVSLLCEACDVSCGECSGSLDTECTSCKNNMSFDSSSGECGCDSGSYLGSGDYTCYNCDASCAECTGGSATECASCKNNMQFDSGAGTCGCLSHWYEDSSSYTCYECDATCAECSGGASTECTSCDADRTLDTSNRCLLICSTNEYRAADLSCQPCDSSCAECSGGSSTECTACSSDKELDSSNRCVDICTSNEYRDTSDLSCQPCDSTCAECSGGSSTECTSCKNNMQFDSGAGTCGCLSHWYFDSSSYTCYQCDAACDECSGGSSTECTSCTSDKTLDTTNNQCLDICATNEYRAADLSCQACDSTCDQCTGGSSTECTACTSDKELDSSNRCVDICLTNEYRDSGDLSCQACDSTCAECSGGSSTECTACTSDKELDSSNRCVDICTSNEYRDTSDLSCQPCDSSCAECSGGSSTECTACTSDKELDSSNRCVDICSTNEYRAADLSCQPCDSSCAECSGGSSTECTACTSDKELDSSNRCVDICTSNEYRDTSDLSCQPCDSSCNQCSGPSSTECTACTSDKLLDSSNRCIDICTSNEYRDTSDLSCQLCDSTCDQCSGPSSTECTACTSDRLLDSSNRCLEICSSHQYRAADLTCQQCDDNCLECSGPASNQCTSCFDRFTLQPSGECLYTNCDSTCFTCGGPSKSECILCQSGLTFLSNYDEEMGRCLAKCPTLYYLDTSTSQATCQSKTAIDNRLAYGRSVTENIITMGTNIEAQYDLIVQYMEVAIVFRSDQPEIPYNYSVKLGPSKTEIIITLTIGGYLLPDNVLSVQYNDFREDNTTQFYLVQNPQQMYMEEYYQYSESTQKAIDAAATVGSIGNKANTVFSWASSFVMYSVHSMRSELVQDMLVRFVYINMDFPPNFVEIANETSDPLDELLPNLGIPFYNQFQKDSTSSRLLQQSESINNETTTSLKPRNALDRYVQNRTFFANFGSTLFLFGVGFLGLGLVEVIRTVSIIAGKTSRNRWVFKIRDIFIYLSYGFRWNFILNQLLSVYLDLLFSSLLEVTNVRPLDNTAKYINYVFGAVGAAVSFLVLIGVYFFTLKVYRTKKQLSQYVSNTAQNEKGNEFLKRFGFMIKSYKSETFYQLLYPFLMTVRSFVFITAIIFLQSAPLVQAIVPCVLTVLIIGYLIKLTPFKLKCQQILTLTYEVMFLVACGTVVGLLVYTKKHPEDIKTRTTLGFILSFTSLAILSVNVVNMVMEGEEFKNMFKKSKKVTPIKAENPDHVLALHVLPQSPITTETSGCVSPQERQPLKRSMALVLKKSIAAAATNKSLHTICEEPSSPMKIGFPSNSIVTKQEKEEEESPVLKVKEDPPVSHAEGKSKGSVGSGSDGTSPLIGNSTPLRLSMLLSSKRGSVAQSESSGSVSGSSSILSHKSQSDQKLLRMRNIARSVQRKGTLEEFDHLVLTPDDDQPPSRNSSFVPTPRNKLEARKKTLNTLIDQIRKRGSQFRVHPEPSKSNEGGLLVERSSANTSGLSLMKQNTIIFENNTTLKREKRSSVVSEKDSIRVLINPE